MRFFVNCYVKLAENMALFCILCIKIVTYKTPKTPTFSGFISRGSGSRSGLTSRGRGKSGF